MAHANVIELETCLEECIRYCADNAGHEFVQFYSPRLDHARDRWTESVERSDHYYLAWQKEFREDRMSWKHLAIELKKTQDALRAVNAIGYPDRIVRHWDEEILADAIREMVAYLESRKDVLDIAAGRIEILTRGLDGAHGENSQAETALKAFKRHVLFRAEAMGTLVATLGDFRVAMRRALGKRSDDYQSIRWPMSVAPDEPVL